MGGIVKFEIIGDPHDGCSASIVGRNLLIKKRGALALRVEDGVVYASAQPVEVVAYALICYEQAFGRKGQR